MVSLNRETGKVTLRPVMKGKAFAERVLSSKLLYDKGSDREHKTEYRGQWAGEILDVEVKWEPIKERIV